MFKIWCFILLTIGPLSCFARPCSSNEYDKAEYFAEINGKKIADSFQGEKNIRTNMSVCKYNSYSDKFKLAIEVYWTGSLSGDTYNVDGELTFDNNGDNAIFSTSYKNQKVKDWEFLRGAMTAVIVLGAASSE